MADFIVTESLSQFDINCLSGSVLEIHSVLVEYLAHK